MLVVIEEEPRLDPVVLWDVIDAVPVVELEAVTKGLKVVLELVSELDAIPSIVSSFAFLNCLRAIVFFRLILASLT